jgi:oxygen-independent coproporphyrinogen-3 oxidase
VSNSAPVKLQTYPWLGMEAPRYTSYPSAHHFSAAVDNHTYRQWLGDMRADASISAYVHIPFCRELCWFCGCHTKMTRRYEPIAKYVRVLLREIETLKRAADGKGKLVNIHFGGGSPSLLEPGDLISILYALASAFEMKPPGELAIELDPRTTTQKNIDLYANLGVNRVSIGIQDFDPKVQLAINRVQPYAMVATVMAQLREAGLNQINADLIYGLPHQTLESFRDTLEKTIALDPARIALFSYAHVPKMKKHQRLIDISWLPSEAQKLDLFSLANEMFKAAGYVPIGIDHFAKADDSLAIAAGNHTLARNFQGYVDRTTDVLIGVGSSSISQFPQGYAQNSAHAVDYRAMVEGGELPIVRGWAFRDDDLIRKQVIDELMCFLSVDLAALRCAHTLGEHYFAAELQELTKPEYRDIVACDGGHVRITTPHRMAARVVASVFDHYRGVAEGRYSKVA